MTSSRLMLISCVYLCLLKFYCVNRLLCLFNMYLSVKIEQQKHKSRSGPLIFLRKNVVHGLEKFEKHWFMVRIVGGLKCTPCIFNTYSGVYHKSMYLIRLVPFHTHYDHACCFARRFLCNIHFIIPKFMSFCKNITTSIIQGISQFSS